MGSCCSNVIGDISQNEFIRLMEQEAVHEDCQIMLAIDATGSNDRTRFGGSVNYHDISTPAKNVYESVINVAVTLMKQDRDAKVPLFFFGSTQANQDCTHPGVLYIGDYDVKNGDPTELLAAYRQGIARQTLDGPTDFRPILNVAAEQVVKTKNYTLLVIISDGGVNADIDGHLRLLRQISSLPLAVTCIGIGDGDFRTMQNFDDALGRRIDNFQFTRMLDVCSLERLDQMQRYFFYRTFMEVPTHHKLCRTVLGYQPKAEIVPVYRQPSMVAFSITAPGGPSALSFQEPGEEGTA
jgi:hypothetical protein